MEALLRDAQDFRELEKTYLKIIKALNIECTRLEEEVERLKKLEEEVEYLRRMELWYIQALKGLNEECNRLEREVYELRRRSTFREVDLAELISSEELAGLLAFAESGISLRSLIALAGWFGIEEVEEEIERLSEGGVLSLSGGVIKVDRRAQRQIREHVLRRIPARDEILSSMNADAIEVVEQLRRRGGWLSLQKFEELEAGQKAAILKLAEEGLIFRTVNREGEPALHMPPEVMELMEELRVEMAKRATASREELMKTLNIRDPSDEEIEVILSTLNESELEPGDIAGNVALIEAFRNEDVDALVEALDSEDVQTRRFAVSALWKIGGEEVLSHLVRKLDDPDVYVRRLAISALLKYPGEELVEPMMEKLEDEDAAVRYSAASYFDNYPSRKAFKHLIRALKDEDRMVRTVAASALGKLGMQEAVPHLIEALRDDDPWVRHCAAEALDRIKAG
ncbi:MAG: HEAT repeat domain-containing protein [Euryarchaeota archaeon]|nr:HEAT repeat domain-containing protein [Euryarchaeota archaeon]